jgi:3-hydroxyisobutyrate dehydrogenase
MVTDDDADAGIGGSTGLIGFIGLGVMGQPMAANLLRAGTPLVVWNRSPGKCEPFRQLGAVVAADVSGVFERAGTVILMLFDRAAIDAALRRGTPDFARMIRGRTVVNMSSIAPSDARALDHDIRAAGGRYVEAPVSGSRIPAENGQLVAMLAGEREVTQEIRPLLAPMCHEQVFCGAVGNGLLMKLAVNLFLVVMVNGLAEAVHFADRQGLDRTHLQAVLNAGPMASSVSRIKLAKFIAGDYSPQAAVPDVLNSTRLITDAARQANAACELIGVCRAQYEDTFDLGYHADDMVAVIRAIEARAQVLTAPAAVADC